MSKKIKEQNTDIKKKRRSTSGNTLAVRVVASILAFLMVASLFATIVSYFVSK